MYGVPTRIHQQVPGDTDGRYNGSVPNELANCAIRPWPIHSTVISGRTKQDVEGYICRLAAVPPVRRQPSNSLGPILAGPGGNTAYYFDDCANITLNYGFKNYYNIAAVAGPPASTYEYNKPYNTYPINPGDPLSTRSAGGMIGTKMNPAGYASWGRRYCAQLRWSAIDDNLGNNGLAITRKISFLGGTGNGWSDNVWYAMNTDESFNGWPDFGAFDHDHSSYHDWLSMGAFRPSSAPVPPILPTDPNYYKNFAGSPIVAIAHSDEPFSGILSNFWKLWHEGALFIHASWGAKHHINFLPIGDPFIRIR